MKSIYFSILFCLTFSFAFAQPANNTCGGATTLTFGAACINGTNTSANTTGDGVSSEPTCWQGGASDWNESVWYVVTLPAGQTSLVVTVTAGTLSNSNTAMQIYSGSCGSLTEVGCVLGGGIVGTSGAAGATYYIMLDGTGGSDGTFCITAAAPTVSNDFQCGAVSLTVGGTCVAGDNTGASTEGLSAPSCWNGPSTNYSNSVWYSFVATDDSITVNPGSGTLETSAITALYSSSNNTCNGTLSEISCANGGNEVNATGLTIGNTYFVMIDGQGTNVGTICPNAYETPPPPPPLGTCENPRHLFINADCNNISGTQYDEQNNMLSTSLTTGNDGGASMSGLNYLNSVETSCSGTDVGQQGYWVTFTGTGTSVNVANYGGAGYDYALFTGTPTNATCTAGLTQTACLTVTAGDLTGNTISTTSGTNYYMLVTPSGTGTSTTAYACLTGTNYSPPYNACGSALSITANTVYDLNNSNATADLNLCAGSMENNIWVYWTAPATWTGTAYVHLFNQDCACGNGLQMSIYTASVSCPPNANPTCIITLNPNNDNNFYGSFTPTPGQTYYMTIDGYAACACAFDFAITGTNEVPLPVELLHFEGLAEKDMNRIFWSTASELNADVYRVEYSENGIDFYIVGTVAASGNSNQIKNYSFTHNVNYIGTGYYRLKQIDYNGRFTYSNMVALERNNFDFTLNVYPNPLNEEFLNVDLFSFVEESVSIQFFDIYGKPLYSQKVNLDENQTRKIQVAAQQLGNQQMVILAVKSEFSMRTIPIVITR